MADMAIRAVSLQEKVEEIDRLSQEIYTENRVFVPLYPWCFVLVCKKTQQLGSIILPDKQNKTVWEGIVLATWADKTVERGTIDKNGVRLTRCEVLRSDLRPGDRVLFEHWAGLPVSGYDQERFRVVRERDWRRDGQGGIFAKVEYHDEFTKAAHDLIEMIAQDHTGREWPALEPEEARMLEAKVNDRYVVVDRDVCSVTLSGT